MKIHDLQPPEGSNRRRKRVGRGIGGKGGKTAGRGTKGQGARDTIPASFEGGQMPLHMRLPKLKGFNNPFRVEYQAINLDVLADSADLDTAWTLTVTLRLSSPRPRTLTNLFLPTRPLARRLSSEI